MDEGDEDREAGIGDEEDEGEASDLEIGDDPTGGGKTRTFHFNLGELTWLEVPDYIFLFCFVLFF